MTPEQLERLINRVLDDGALGEGAKLALIFKLLESVPPPYDEDCEEW